MKLYSNELVNARIHIDTEFTPFSKSDATRITHIRRVLCLSCCVFRIVITIYIYSHFYIVVYIHITLLYSRKMHRYLPSYYIHTYYTDGNKRRVYSTPIFSVTWKPIDVCVHALARMMSSCVYGKYFIPIRTTDKEKYLSHRHERYYCVHYYIIIMAVVVCSRRLLVSHLFEWKWGAFND